MDLLQTARNELGPFSIHRLIDVLHNAMFQAQEKVDLIRLVAVDIHVSNSQHRKKLIDYFATKVTGLGVAKTFLHIDLLTPELGFDET